MDNSRENSSRNNLLKDPKQELSSAAAHVLSLGSLWGNIGRRAREDSDTHTNLSARRHINE